VQQVKVRIFQPSVIRNRLKLMGAKFLGSWNEKDTYFLQPANCFLKIKRTRGTAFLVKMCRAGEWGLKKEVKPVKNVEKKEKELSEKFGVLQVVEKRVHSYKYGDSGISIHSLPVLGDFLIIEGKFSDAKTLLKKLGIEKPEFVSLAFSEMA
jgi:adenylate cyclase class IV